jgi:hypothetical protein
VAASAPKKPVLPVTTIVNNFVRVTWIEPATGSAAINGYKVYIADKDGLFREETTYCNGSINPVLSQKYCEVPMSVLRIAPYSLLFDALVKAKVMASNIYGDGPISDPNTTGAKI